MDLNKLEGNSRNKQEVSDHVRDTIVKGAVQRQKPSVGSRLQSELNNQWSDVLLPAAKDMIVDMLRSGLDGLLDISKRSIDMKIYGEVKGHHRRGGKTRNSYTSYYSGSGKTKEKSDPAPYYENLLFETRADAVAVLEGLTDILEEFEVVSVGDLLELAGEKPHYTDRKYGWFKLGRAEIIGTRDGYILSMPRPVVIQ